MQMLARSSDEGKLPGLGWIAGAVRGLGALMTDQKLPLPHMGWNDVRVVSGGGLFDQLDADARFYFLHSYYFDCDRPDDAAAVSSYGGSSPAPCTPRTSTACSFIQRRVIDGAPACCRTSRASDMLRPRISPCLLVHKGGLVKTRQFGSPTYVGDPINAVKIFNEKEADELIVLDINATRDGVEPNFRLIAQFAVECRMPLCYGGGIKTVDQARRSSAWRREDRDRLGGGGEPALISDIAEAVGSQSVVVVLDVKRSASGATTKCGPTTDGGPPGGERLT
jgi:hypothetical protein